jgi:phospholipid/cholesterol/gamma-HCH transport system substrate-binding protein
VFSTIRLGAFILAGLIVFGFLVFLIGNKQFVFSHTYRVRSAFDNVVGLDKGAAVRAGGVRVGVVQNIDLPHNPEDKITVDMALETTTREVVKKDSIASIETEGLLGAKYVAISFGSQESEPIQSGDTIQSHPPIDYSDLVKKASHMLDSANQAVDSSQVAIQNVSQATEGLKSITGKIDSGRGTIGALVNDQSVYRNLNATMSQANAGATAFQEDMEALKHNWLLRGFFNKRGYFDSTELTKHAVNSLPKSAPVKTFDLEGKDLFKGSNGTKLARTKALDEIGAFLQSNQFSLAVVQAETGGKGDKDQDLKISLARAAAVREYLVQHFKMDDTRIKTRGLGKDVSPDQPGGKVAVLVYPSGRTSRTAEARVK